MEEFLDNIWKMIVESNVLHLIWALLILLIGWLLAVVISNRAGIILRNWGVGKKLSNCLPEGAHSSAVRVETVITRIIFWLILLFTVLGCLSALNLSETAEPIRNFADSIIGYAANLIGAALLIFVAWIVASVLRFAALSAMKACKIDEKFAESGKPVSATIGSTVYWLVFFFFIPAILRALEIRGITEPLEQMFAKVLDFLPNLLLAAAVLVVGLWAAKIVRRAVSGLLFAVRLDEVGEKIGCGKVFGEQKLSSLVGLVAYVLVALPVLISSLTALRIETLSNSVADFFNMILTAAGNIFGAAVLIFAAFIAGSLASGIIAQLLEGFGFDKLMAHVCGEAKTERAKPSVVVGKLSLIAVMFMAVIAACELLRFQELANLLRDFLHFGGNILVGIVVLLIGIYLANLAAGAIRSRGEHSEALALTVRIAVLVFTGAIALSNMEIGSDIVRTAFALLLGAICVATALAFGLGGREFAAKKLEEWNKRLSGK